MWLIRRGKSEDYTAVQTMLGEYPVYGGAHPLFAGSGAEQRILGIFQGLRCLLLERMHYGVYIINIILRLRPNLNIKVVQIGQRNLYRNFLASKKAPPPLKLKSAALFGRTRWTCLRSWYHNATSAHDIVSTVESFAWSAAALNAPIINYSSQLTLGVH